MKTMKSKSIFFLSIFLSVLTLSSVGQSSKTNDETFLGIGSGSRKIIRSLKNPISPLHVDSTMEMEEIKYYLEPKQIEVSYDIESIRPARLKIVEPLEKLYAGYLKAGAGSYVTPFLELNYASKRSKDNSWGIKGKTQSSFADIKNMGNTRYTDASLGGYFQKFFLDNDLWADFDYEKNKYQFYGLNYYDSASFEPFKEDDSSFHQNYDLFDLHVKFNSKNTGRDTNKLRYKTWLDFHHLNSKYQLNENHFLVGAHSGWVIMDEEFLGTFELDINNLSQPSSIELDTNSNEINVPNDPVSKTSAIIRFNPHIYTRKKNLIAKVGISLQAGINDSANNSNFKFFPDIEISYSLFNNVFIPYGGLKGNIQRNTFNDIRTENPFISEDSDVFNTIQRVNLFGGIRGSLSSKFTFNVSTSFEKLDNFYFFSPDTISSYENKFQLTYDKVDRTTFMGELTYQEEEKLKITAKAEYFIYAPVSEDFAWQRPDFKFTLGSVLDLSDKIIVRADVFFIGARNVYSFMEPSNSNNNIVLNQNKDIEFEEINDRYIYKLKPFIDMNLGAEYRYNKKVSAFIQFNNFTAKKYQFWTNFPVQSINIMGGVTLSF